MKSLVFSTGGRPVHNDDLQTLQSEYTTALLAPYLGLGAFIVSGCAVSGPAGGPYDVGPGLVCLDGEFVRFYGQSGVTLPMQFERNTTTPFFLDSRVYQTGATNPCIVEYAAQLVPVGSTPAGREFVLLTERGGKMWRHVVQEQSRSVGEIQWLATLNMSDYDNTGKGLFGTEAWGWALCYGGPVADMRGRVPAGYAPGASDYAVGVMGGADMVTLGLDNMPPHNHTGGQGTARFAVANGLRTANLDPGDYDNSPNEPNLDLTLPVQMQGAGLPFDNRAPYRGLGCRQWIGYAA
jgi:hypothetical protein